MSSTVATVNRRIGIVCVQDMQPANLEPLLSFIEHVVADVALGYNVEVHRRPLGGERLDGPLEHATPLVLVPRPVDRAERRLQVQRSERE